MAMIVTLDIEADDLTLSQVLDRFSKQYNTSYSLTREESGFVLRIRTDDLGELVRRLNHIKDSKVQIKEIFESRPFANVANVNMTKTNIDALMGRTTVAQTDITPVDGGLVKVVGETWLSRPQYDRVINKGARVKIVGVEGVSLIVEEVEETC